MIIEAPKSPLPGKLRGLHLFHDGIATCAQRVRFVLAEKGFERGPDVAWDSAAPETLAPPHARAYVSRVVSIRKKENLSAGYAAIQPNMVVPALVHDGVLHIESVDILRYLDERFPEPTLVPRDRARGALCHALVDEARALHVAIRFILFRWALPGSVGKISAELRAELRRLEQPDSPEALADFYESYSTDAFSEAVFVERLRSLERGFARVDALLADGRPWLTGDDFSMADIMWALKMLRLWEIRYPLEEHYPSLAAWHARVLSRRSYREAVWRDTHRMSLVVRTWSAACHLAGGGVGKHAARVPAESRAA